MTKLHARSALLKDGWHRDVALTLLKGRIASIEIGAAAGADDERHAVIVPAMPNLHSHAFQRAMAGLTERRGAGDDSFWSWRELMYRFNARIGPDALGAIAAMAYVEMLEAGFTRVGEFHYLHHAPDGTPYTDRAEMAAAICEAAAETGMALTLLPVFYAHAGFGGQAPNDGQRRFIHDVDGFAALLEASRRHAAHLPDAVVGVAPHSLRAVTEDELRVLLPLAAGGPVHIHIAEQTKEVDDCLAFSGQRPVEWLLDRFAVDPSWCLVHATHLSTHELDRLVASGAVAGLCPITEANLGDGLFPARDFLRGGGRFGIGSDSNVMISVAEELRLLEYGQRLFHRERNVLADPLESTGGRLYRQALAGGAQALDGTTGLALGQPADVISLDLARDVKGDDVLDSFVFASPRSPVDCVWRRGVKQVAGGRHVLREPVRRAFEAVVKALRA